ncbi:MAG: hypothetical protein ACE5JB_04315 [bacterium]
MRNLNDELDKNDRYPPSWYLSEGAKVIGKIAAYKKAYTSYGSAWVCQIEDEKKGLLSVWLTHTVLLDQFKRLKPKIGERVGIKCLGKHQEKKYWQFRVVVDREEAEVPIFEEIQAWDKEAEELTEESKNEEEIGNGLPF